MVDALSGATSPRRAPLLLAALLALAALVAVPIIDPDGASPVEASAGRPLAVIVVGPV